MMIEHYRRGDDGWLLDVLSRPSDSLVFDAIDFAVELSAIYADVPVLGAGYEDDVPILIP